MTRRWFKSLLTRYSLSFRNRVVTLVVGMVICTLSLIYTNRMAHNLREKEQHDVEIWVLAMEQANRDAFGGTVNDPLIQGILSNRNNIPFIITDEKLNVIQAHLVPREVLDHPDRLRQQIDRFVEENQPKRVNYWWSNGHNHIIFYGKSRLLKSLYLFPYVQLGVIIFFIFVGFIAFRSSKRDEQNRVWIGLAKETAHQLGTPTSSLLGWIEYLRSQPVDQEAVEEMNKDLAHLMKIVDRFSKIGSETVLQKAVINEVVGEAVMYFRKRIPRNVTLDYNGLAMAHPVEGGRKVTMKDYFTKGDTKTHLIGLLGGFIWMSGMVISFMGSGGGNPAVNYALSNASPVVAMIWGVLIWKEFKGAPKGTNKLLFAMFFLFIAALVLISMAN